MGQKTVFCVKGKQYYFQKHTGEGVREFTFLCQIYGGLQKICKTSEQKKVLTFKQKSQYLFGINTY